MERHLLDTEEWNMVGNSQKFCASFYSYYYKGGFSNIACDGIFNILSCVMICNALFVFVAMEDDFSVHITSHIFALVFLTSVASLYSINLVKQISEFIMVKNIYEQELNIANPKMYKWEEVMCKMILKNKTKKYIVKDLNVITFTNQITYEKNLITLLVCNDLIPCFVHSRLLDQALLLCIRGTDHHSDKTFCKRAQCIGYALVCLMPLTFMFLLVTNIVEYCEEVRKNKCSLLKLCLTIDAEWKFRRFNEVEHTFVQRMNTIVPLVERYMIIFAPSYVKLLQKTISFMFALLFCLIVLLSFKHNDITNVNFLDFNIFWWCTLILTFSSNIKTMQCDGIDSTHVRHIIEQLEEQTDLKNTWRTNQTQLLDKMKLYFKPCFVIILIDILSVFTAPFYMICSLPNKKERFVQVLQENTLEKNTFFHENQMSEPNFANIKCVKSHSDLVSLKKSVEDITNHLTLSEIMRENMSFSETNEMQNSIEMR